MVTSQAQGPLGQGVVEVDADVLAIHLREPAGLPVGAEDPTETLQDAPGIEAPDPRLHVAAAAEAAVELAIAHLDLVVRPPGGHQLTGCEVLRDACGPGACRGALARSGAGTDPARG